VNICRTAFIGCGKRAHEHARGVRADPRCQVVAVADVQQEAAIKLKEEQGFPDAAVYMDYREMLQAVRPDLVILCLWTPLHLPVFRACAEAGVKSVVSEKPMAPTWGECLEMARIAEQSKTQLSFCHQRRFSAGNRYVRKLIEEGRFGKIERMDLYSPPNLLDCGTHTFDQALSFNREIPAKWVLGAVDASEPIRWFGVSAEAMAVGTLVFENGVRANIQVGGPDQDMWGGVRVLGSEGFVEVFWDGDLRRAVVYGEPSWKPDMPEIVPGEDMRGVIRNAVDCLESGEEPELSYRKALRATEIIFAFYESVRRHARITLPLQDVSDNPFVTMLESGAFGPADRKGAGVP